jgi:hypothetical protein
MNFPLPLLMILAMMLWGGGWPALKILTESVPWEVATFWRFALMTLAFFPVLWWHKAPFRVSPRALGWAGLSAMLNALNLQAGDVITAINGQRLGDLEQDKALLESWRDQPQLEIEIERDGTLLTVSYAIPEQWR